MTKQRIIPDIEVTWKLLRVKPKILNPEMGKEKERLLRYQRPIKYFLKTPKVIPSKERALAIYLW